MKELMDTIEILIAEMTERGIDPDIIEVALDVQTAAKALALPPPDPDIPF